MLSVLRDLHCCLSHFLLHLIIVAIIIIFLTTVFIKYTIKIHKALLFFTITSTLVEIWSVFGINPCLTPALHLRTKICKRFFTEHMFDPSNWYSMTQVKFVDYPYQQIISAACIPFKAFIRYKYLKF